MTDRVGLPQLPPEKKEKLDPAEKVELDRKRTNAFVQMEEISVRRPRTERRCQPRTAQEWEDLVSQHQKMVSDQTKKSFFQNQDIWMHIFSFVGPGHFGFVAPVSKQFKEWYKASFDLIERPLEVYRYYRTNGRRTNPTVPATSTDTFFSVTFSSIASAKIWREEHMGFDESLPCSIFSFPDERLPDNNVCTVIASYGNLDVLKWARQQGFDWNEDMSFPTDACSAAASGGHLDVLKYLHDNDCPWTSYTCSRAAKEGHLEVLKYLHKNRCPWNKWTCSAAAENGNLNCLKYLHQNGCPWDGKTYCYAIENGHDDIAQWAKNNGCPVDE